MGRADHALISTGWPCLRQTFKAWINCQLAPRGINVKDLDADLKLHALPLAFSLRNTLSSYY
jgi:hypothetical protein